MLIDFINEINNQLYEFMSDLFSLTWRRESGFPRKGNGVWESVSGGDDGGGS